MSTVLRALPPLLREVPALAANLGASVGTLAVPEPGRAITVAALAHLTERRPLLVAVPTTADAERLVHDLEMFLGPEQVDWFPPWETLPFERVSPGVETMGRRLRTIWRLAEGRPARVVVATAKALIQRLGPAGPQQGPIVVERGTRLDEQELVARLVGLGYRREYQVEHRGEVAVRGGIVDVFPSTADGPVRIDLWGDEVDRLTDFDVFDQRSTEERERVEIFGCREVLPDDAVRARAQELL
ncbi:MAG TPA: transcription-repair coupling factor, partial [Acidimicrobiales bacterium]|nr:transcription-repair coupling factor [Acidimicrobiales bacterium]